MHSLPYFKECSAREQRFYAFGAEGLIYACPGGQWVSQKLQWVPFFLNTI